MIIWYNGEFKESAPVFGVDDRIRLGDGVFDTMLAVDGHLQHADLHLARLIHDAGVLGMKGTLSVSELEAAAVELLARNQCTEGHFAISTVISRGPWERGLKLPENENLQTVMRAVPAPKPEEFPPVHAIICETVRRNEGSPLSQIKSCNYGDNILALMEAEEKGANEAILLNNAGNITCASAGNIFAEIDGTLYTPPLSDGVMPGVTRELMIKEYGAKEKTLTPEDLQNAQGLTITNSIRGASPIQSVDGTEISQPSLKIAKDFHLS